MIATLMDDEDDPSKPTCSCWVGTKSNCFAIGYDDGSILLWGIPGSSLPDCLMGKSTIVKDVVLVMSLHVSAEVNSKSAPIKSMQFLEGGEGTPHNKECLLVYGGQCPDDPNMLTLVSLQPQGSDDQVTIPWFGTIVNYCLVGDVFFSLYLGMSLNLI